MSLHILGLGNIGSLLAHEIRRRHPVLPIAICMTDAAALRRLVAREGLQPTGTATPRRFDGLSIRFKVEHGNVAEIGVSLTRGYTVLDCSDSDESPSSANPNLLHPSFEMIKMLVITTKAPQTLNALAILKKRLSKDSTIFMLQNGMGIIDEAISHVFPDPASRPTFIIGTTSHGVYASRPEEYDIDMRHGTESGKKHAGRIYHHVGLGTIQYSVLPKIPCYPHNGRSDITISLLRALRQSSDFEALQLVAEDSKHSTKELLNLIASLETLQPDWITWPRLLVKQLVKLAINATVNTLTAIFGRTNDLCLENEALQIAMQVASECEAIFSHLLGEQDSEKQDSTASQRSAEDGSEPGNDEKMRLPQHLQELCAKSIFESIVHTARLTGSNFSSMASDVWGDRRLSPTTTKGHAAAAVRSRNAFEGNPGEAHFESSTEIAYINGFLSRLAESVHVPAPTITMLAHLVLLTEKVSRQTSCIYKG